MTLAFKEYGPPDAPSVIFLHGVSVSGWMWRPVVKRLQAELHCLVPDLPGHGESAALAWRSPEDDADRSAQLIQRWGHGGQAVVVGLSLGAYVGLRLLQRHPELIRGAILSGLMAHPTPGPAFQRLLTAVMLPLMHTDYYVRSTAQLLRLPPEAAPLFKRDVKRLPIDTMRRVLRAVTTFQMPELAAPPPLLFMAGADENREIVGRLDEFKALYPGAQTEVVSGAHHAWPGEQPEVLAQRIRALLGTNPR